MKNRNLILSVLFWAVASVCFAITLPSSSYNAYSAGDADESFTLGVGSTFNNAYLTASTYTGSCTYEAFNGDVGGCQNCCEKEFTCGDYDFDCWDLRGLCIDQCGEPLGGLPLGSPLLLLPFIAVYAVVRRNRKDNE